MVYLNSLISPIAVHLSEEVNENMKSIGLSKLESVFHSTWPNPSLLPSFENEYKSINQIKQLRGRINTQIEALRDKGSVFSNYSSLLSPNYN